MEFGDLLSKSWEEYKQNFWVILKIFLVLSLIPSVIFAILVFAFGPGETEITTFSEILVYLPFVFGMLVIIILSFIMSLVYTYLGFYGKKSMGFGKAVKGGLGYFWKYILLTILLFIIFVLFLLPTIISAFFVLVNPFILLFSILFFIIGFVFVIKYFIFWVFATFVLVKENVGVLESMKRSKAIVKGRWWGTLGYMILLGIIMVLISIPFNVIGFILPFVASLSALITTPLGILFMKNFYLDRKNSRKK